MSSKTRPSAITLLLTLVVGSELTSGSSGGSTRGVACLIAHRVNSHLYLEDSLIANNEAMSDTGGGVIAEHLSYIRVARSLIDGNKAPAGGGFSVQDNSRYSRATILLLVMTEQS